MKKIIDSAAFRFAALLLLCCFVITSCATTSSAKIPVFELDAENGVYKVAAVSYGSDSKQKFDIYLPADYKAKDSLDMLVYIHGGAYYRGSRYDQNEICLELARNGAAVAIMDYRLVSPTNNIFLKDMFEDVCTAIDKIAFVCEANNVKLDKAAVMGISAGAHFALLYSYKMKETSPLNLVFCVDYVGPADLKNDDFIGKIEDDRFAQLGKLLKKRLKVEDMKDAIPYFIEYSPIEYLEKTSVPTICAYGKKDDIVPFSVCESLVKKFDSLGCTYELTVFPNSNHGLDAPEDIHLRDVVFDQIQDYMKKYF
ncbi:MAG: alpha/beta hydrolase [Spirochaetaceae bacterium]|nr:alpha/beta hydrolase [Spirochaetaceae bacterium]